MLRLTKTAIIAGLFAVILARSNNAQATCYSYWDWDWSYSTYCDGACDGYCDASWEDCPNDCNAAATTHIIYLHGRSMASWPTGGVIPVSSLPSGWNNVTLSYDGDNRMWGPANDTIKAALRANCTNGQQCVVVAYSAGMNRLLYALNQLNAEGTPPTILFTEAIASAAGGTPVSEYTTKWYLRLLAKIFGKDADIDNDLHVGDWMWGGYSVLQNLAPSPVFHAGAGRANMCTKIHFFFWTLKLCGNGQFPGEAGDGAVPVFSACGYASPDTYGDCCASGYKFANRTFEGYGSCNYNANHQGMIPAAMPSISTRIIGYATYVSDQSGGVPTDNGEPTCNEAYDDCDLPAPGQPYLYTYEPQTTAGTGGASTREATCEYGRCLHVSFADAEEITGTYWTCDPYYYYCWEQPYTYYRVTQGGSTWNCYTYNDPNSCYPG